MGIRDRGDRNLQDAKYQRLVSLYKKTDDENKKQTKMSAAREQVWKTYEKNVRETMEPILATDDDLMHDRNTKPWGDYDLNELSAMTKEAFKKYQQRIRDLLLRLSNECNNRRIQIETLQEQNKALREQLLNGGPREIPENLLKNENASENADDDEHKTPAHSDSSKSRTPGRAAARQMVFVEEEDDDDPENNEVMNAACDSAGAVALPGSPAVTPAQSEMRKKVERRVVATHVANGDTVEDFIKLMDDYDKSIVKILGDAGFSARTEILTEFLAAKDPRYNKSRFTSSISSMSKQRIILCETIKIAPKPNMNLVKLSDLGRKIYLSLYKKAPVDAEMDILKREHTSLEHGYSIKYFAEFLKESGQFKDVVYINHRQALSDSEHGRKSIPDITCTTEHGKTMYIEYELGHTPQRDFNSKCNKLLAFTDCINIVVPNLDVIEILLKSIDAYLRSKMTEGSKNCPALEGKTIRLSAHKTFGEGQPIDSDRVWSYVFKPAERIEPYQHI